MERTAQATAEAPPTQPPPDIETMRATAARLLGPDDGPDTLPPSGDELDTLTGMLREHLELLIPEVECAAGRLNRENIDGYCALACVGEARGKLRARPGAGEYGAVAYARKLARVLKALCDHHDNLPRLTSWQAR
jgi:hypothetical protein